MINKLFSKIESWVKKNRFEAILIILILLVGAFFRLYRIEEYMTFLGDEGRDVIIVRRLLVDLDPILIGPGTSIGDMYLGPLYYYMMAPALLLANFSPVGPAVMIALLGVATIFFVWFVGRDWFGKLAGITAASLYAVSPVVITYSRSSWNPNIMPFFALLSIYSIWKVWRKNKYGWLIIAGMSMAFVLQSHYLGLLLAPTLGLFWSISFLAIRDKREEKRKFIVFSLLAFFLFAILMSPLVIFDARHGWRNFAAMKIFFSQRQTTLSARPWTAIPKIPEIISSVNTRLLAGASENVGKWVTIGMVAGVFWLATSLLYSNEVRKRISGAYFLLAVWLGVAFVGLGVYKQEIYDHYYGFFFTAPFLLIGGIAQDILQSGKKKGMFLKLFTNNLLLVALITLVVVNLKDNPLKYPPGRQLQRTQNVVDKIILESGGRKLNLAVLAERNYEGAYQYLLEREMASFVKIDPQRYEETVTDELFVICELPREKCDPVNNSKAEIANFGWSKVEEEWKISGVILYKLVHAQ